MYFMQRFKVTQGDTIYLAAIKYTYEEKEKERRARFRSKSRHAAELVLLQEHAVARRAHTFILTRMLNSHII